nr:ecto-ADP-ribosyltransferase 5-like [Danio rerio]XP_021327034.1 ecto-ADP-ribosyltransferase 5-like [Danio rerio]|eukprot:XP_003198090.2 ecto-ADP-ribosyltransferase 5-like [Danio rerio]
MKMMIEALLLVVAALQDHTAAAVQNIYPLDMAVNSVDDQYDGCTIKMANLVKTKYLEKELKNSNAFNKAWEEGEENSTAPQDNLKRNHSIAIYVYTNLDSSVYSSFNMASRNGKQNYTDQTFTWYSLHFLLTDAIQILSESQKKCKTTFRGTNVSFYRNVTGKVIRFGSFTSSSLDRKVAQGFGNKSCFRIKTCNGANVVKYSKYPDQKEVLIPPYEKFKVTAIKTKEVDKNLWCETVYALKSAGTRSDLNCTLAFKKTMSFKTIRFCRCINRKIKAIAQAVNRGHYKSVRFGRKLSVMPNKMLEDQLSKPNRRDEEMYQECINVFHFLVENQMNPTNRNIYIRQQIAQKQDCRRFLNTLGFDPLILELLNPCCAA